MKKISLIALLSASSLLGMEDPAKSPVMTHAEYIVFAQEQIKLAAERLKIELDDDEIELVATRAPRLKPRTPDEFDKFLKSALPGNAKVKDDAKDDESVEIVVMKADGQQVKERINLADLLIKDDEEGNDSKGGLLPENWCGTCSGHIVDKSQQADESDEQ